MATKNKKQNKNLKNLSNQNKKQNKNLQNLEKQIKNLKLQKTNKKRDNSNKTNSTTMPSRRRNGRNPNNNTSMGAKIGSQIGDFVQKGATALFKSVTGFGDYKIKANTLLSGASPAVFRGGDRSTIVRHREYIQDITGSTSFVNTSYPINPANTSTFPWLAAIASSYEQYKIHGLIFEYKSTSADSLNSTNTALGTVILATDYNVLNTAFTSKTQMENFEFCVSCRPSESCLHPVECDPTQTPTNEFYVSASSAGGDLRFVNMGNFQLATVGMQATAVIGELWATFEVELIKPRLNASLLPVFYCHTQHTGVSSTNLFNPSPVYVAQTNTQNVTFSFGSSSVRINYLIPGAIYQTWIEVQGGAGQALIAPTVNSPVNVTNTPGYDVETNAGTSMSTGSTTDTRVFSHYTFTVNNAATYVVLNYSASTLPASPTLYYYITRLA